MTTSASAPVLEDPLVPPSRDPLVPAARPRLGVHSEAGVLRTVVLDGRVAAQAPGLGEALAERGIRALLLDGLLADVLAATSVRRILAERVAMLEATSPAGRRRIRAALLRAEPDDAARLILHGIPATDRDQDSRSPDRARYLMPPLPDTRSLRQGLVAVAPRPFAALQSGREARRATTVLSAVWQAHPAFAAARPRRYRPDPELRRSDALLDGDDVQTAPDGSVVVGVGHRSNLRGARQLALSVLGPAGAPRVVVVPLSNGPAARLDELMAVLGRRTVLVHPASLADDTAAWELLPGDETTGPALRARRPRPFRDVLPGMLDADPSVLVVPAVRGASGPQHHLVLEPGAVLTSAPAGDPTSAVLEHAGVELRFLDDDVAASRAGGVRRIVLPVGRDPLRLASGPTAL